MKKILQISQYSFFLLLIASCDKEENIPVDTSLSVKLIASSYEIKSGDSVTVSVEVKNADSLFALSFELRYDPELLNIDPQADIVSTGNLFLNPFPAEPLILISDGQVSLGLGEWGSIQKTVSGTACYMVFTALSKGTGALYVSSIDMIKKDGSEIDGLDNLLHEIDPLEIQVIE